MTSRLLCCVGILLLCSGFAAGQSPTPSSFYGMHVRRPTSAWPSFPVKHLRLWDSGTRWSDIETSDGVYDWSVLDAWFAVASKHGATDLLFTFGHVPQWASGSPNNTNCDNPGDCIPPKDVNSDGSGTDLTWQTFISAFANHVGTRIAFYERWNEPFYSKMWGGTNAQLLRMERDAKAILLAGNPSAKFLTGSLSVNSSGHTQWTKSYLAAGGGQDADIISYHRYGNPSGQSCPADYQAAAKDAAALRGLLPSSLKAKPLWHTEGSWSSRGSTGCMTQAQQAAWLPKWEKAMQSAGVQRDYWYGLDHSLGTLYVSGRFTPAAIAWGKLAGAP